MTEQFLQIIAGHETRPSLIERITDEGELSQFKTNIDSNIVYVAFFGTPLDCATSESDKKFLIQAYIKCANGQEATGFAFGVKEFNRSWSERQSLKYKLSRSFEQAFLEPEEGEAE
ncbi:MAG: hypothetical protein MJZ30_09420 [Paludibacteraceae bacterium]|nr:hypothetical protein [Paludibacteraceae bacterium]